MDIIREQQPRKKRRIIKVVVAVVAIGAVTMALRNLQPAAPSVDRATVWMDTVQRGTMVRKVRGPGTLVPEQRRWITAVTAGRIEQLYMLPGTHIDSSTVILRLSNPDVEVQLLTAQQALSSAEAGLITLRSNLATQRLTQEGMVAQTRTQYLDAKRVYDMNQRLFDTNPDLVAEAELARSRELAEEMETRLDLELRRLEVMEASVDEQIQAQETQIERLHAIVQFNTNRVASMEVTAGVTGVLAELPVQEGEWVQSGGILARVVQPGRLFAQVRIPQTQAQDVTVGQVAFIDTRNDTIEGRVRRIDPAVRNATITIDVALPDDLPNSARPDLTVDGTVVIDRLDDVVYMGRPAYGQSNSTVGIFKLVDGGDYAERINVRLGLSSVNEIEIREGLQPGEVVILSDMSQWDGFDRVRLR